MSARRRLLRARHSATVSSHRAMTALALGSVSIWLFQIRTSLSGLSPRFTRPIDFSEVTNRRLGMTDQPHQLELFDLPRFDGGGVEGVTNGILNSGDPSRLEYHPAGIGWWHPIRRGL